VGRGLISPDTSSDDETSVSLVLEEQYQTNALIEKFKDISNRLVLPKADVGRLFVGRGEAGAGS
jgi:hypothetical protein